jgi:nicotinate phosphoribosyltransferase
MNMRANNTELGVASLTDCDLYKLNMLRVYFQSYADSTATFRFKCRNKNVVFTRQMVDEIKDQLKAVCEMSFSESDVQFIGHQRYHHDAIGFREFLRMYKLNPFYINVEYDENEPCHMKIWATGPIWQASMFEIYTLETVSEVYFKYTAPITPSLLKLNEKNLKEKIEMIKKHFILLTDFGCRRRHSRQIMDLNINMLVNELPPTVFSGTSSVYFAKKYGITPQGTFAHEFVEAAQGLDNVSLGASQKYAFQLWANTYRGDLGTALTDTLGTDKFLKDFDRYFAMLFSGLRHDSGDPFIWGDRMIEMYKGFGIDPKTKLLLFSDSLNIPKAIKIDEYFKDKIKVAFGIGTNLMNDVGVEPLNIVMKLEEINGHPAAKLSDDPGKTMSKSDDFVTYLRKVIV